MKKIVLLAMLMFMLDGCYKTPADIDKCNGTEVFVTMTTSKTHTVVYTDNGPVTIGGSYACVNGKLEWETPQ